MTNTETGMLDVGTHCSFCRQLDFLPFHCKYCNGDFCGAHRTPQKHRCEVWAEQEKTKQQQQEERLISTAAPESTSKTSSSPSFHSLLPEKAHIRVQRGAPSSTSVGRSVRERLESAGQGSAVAKLKSFFQRRSQSSGSATAKKPPGPAARLVELAKQKKCANGDPAIPQANRVYVYCHTIDTDTNIEQVRHELFLNKIWPVGRALDSIASQLGVHNRNSQAASATNDKLFLYREEKTGDPRLLDPSNRVRNCIFDLDTLLLVRGQHVP
ncbi:LAME_0H06436g1_1 [Lachancea meyersii CBS 8951]|uniref:LAME_0H06436g1_1 n=1 Tax=Lachancea meyersii CBS 8951 TaxID=1266667 RepID=A0A1G4KEP9_9SACH|nr:LAME_0H06436g1_1 [Lachancea meyersii CBS 8951]